MKEICPMVVSEESAYKESQNLKKNKLALVIGVNNSATPNTRETLKYAERDAAEMAWVLEETPCGFGLIEPALRGQDAKTWEIQHAIMRLVEGRTDQDFLLFYFSGHAQPIETPGGHKDIYLVTYNFKESDVMLYPAMHISMRWLREMFYQKTRAGAVLVILDCCYAGNIIRSGGDPYHIDLGKLIENWLEEPNQVPKDRPRMMLTATGYDISAQEVDGHGHMTYWMIKALRGADTDVFDDYGQVDISSLHKYLKKNIPEQCPNLAGEFGQHPWILASYPEQSVNLRRSAQKAEEGELKTQVIQLTNKLSEVSSIITDPNYFTRLAEEDAHYRAQQFDQITDKSVSITDLNQAKVTDFFKIDRVQIQDDFDREVSEQEQLRYFSFLQASHPTNGALLCFGLTPTKWVAGAFTKCILWIGNDRSNGWLDSQDYRRDLITQFESSRDFLRKNLRLSRIIGIDGSVEELEIPMVALREALANALVHREYAHQTSPVYVDIFNDRVEITSPGILPEPMTLEVLKEEHTSHPRNPQIARIFYLYKYVEKVGSGIQRMQRAVEKAGLSPIKLAIGKDETVKVIFYRPKQDLKDVSIQQVAFVVYEPGDGDFVEHLHRDLASSSVRLWSLEREQFSSTLSQSVEIRDAMRNASLVILIASPATASSYVVKMQMNLAADYRRPVLVFWVRGEDQEQPHAENWQAEAVIDARAGHYETARATLVARLKQQEKMASSPHTEKFLPTEPRNPYKGLRAFTEEDAHDFFGREALVSKMTTVLEQILAEDTKGKQPTSLLLTILGASGSGKSSVVMAGLLPFLQRVGISNSQEWIYLDSMRPGNHPLDALATSLVQQPSLHNIGNVLSLSRALASDSLRTLHLLARQIAGSSSRKVVLFIDQFEEVFTLTTSEEERQRFFDLLVATVTEPHGSLLVLLTLCDLTISLSSSVTHILSTVRLSSLPDIPHKIRLVLVLTHICACSAFFEP